MKIKLYTTHCPQCRALETKLERKSIEYDVCDDTEEMKALGFKTAPILEVDGERLNFSDAIRWVNAQ